MDSFCESHDVVIVGAGICGLATALALHRKGIKSLVLERAESLRATGVSLVIHHNGWLALDYLGVGLKLRQKSVLISGLRYTSLDDNFVKEQPSRELEQRCVKRSDLIETLSEDLPPETLRFSCRVVAVKTDPSTPYNFLHLDDGSSIHAKVLIGCDGVNSIVSDTLGLKPAIVSSIVGIRGLTNYPNGHHFTKEFIQFRRKPFFFGRYPIDDKQVYWFLARPWNPKDIVISRDPQLITKSTLEAARGFPTEFADLVKRNDMTYLSCTRIRYRSPWELLVGQFHKGTVTVAGDAMHAMGPFVAQGGSSALEDAVVLARCLATRMEKGGDGEWEKRMESALRDYVNKRRRRVLRLSTQTYLMGLVATASWKPVNVVAMLLIILLFGKGLSFAQYDCGPL